MKLEWGRKVCCPSCTIPFYDLQRTSLVCPNCGSAFESSDLWAKKGLKLLAADVEEDVIDEELAISDFGFSEEETEDVELSEDSGEILVETGIDDIKRIDEG
ncbi:MAG: FYDLN acid domain-containing protein [Holosporales bacterium]|jgi:uncharacterized protein (TIGR02300 family)|nr:FYDLN acid domain-containing protein [Holosporales bacterium]